MVALVMKMTDLIIILGSPASGKTTLARRLSGALALPYLCKDDIKEALFEVLGVPDRAGSRRLSDASFAAQLRLAHSQLGAGLSCIIEGNWRGEHAPAVSAILQTEGSRACQIACRAAAAEITHRFTSRLRHPGHLDAAVNPEEVRKFADPPTFMQVAGPRWLYDSDDPGAYGGLLHTLQCWRL
jgi:predicted kinase